MTHEMCRLCLSKQNLGVIFVDFDQSERYTAVLALTTGLKIEPNDEFSQQICDNCTASVNSCLKFRNQCHKSHIKLLQLSFSKKSYLDYENKILARTDNNPHLEKHDFIEEINEDSIETTGFTNFEIEVECQRVTDCENSGKIKQDGGIIGVKTNIQDGGSREKIEKKENNGTVIKEAKTMSRKERRKLYLGLVDGVLDPKGPVRCRMCKKTVSKWSCFISHAKLHLGFKFMCEFCGKSFISSTQLKRHCRSHHGMQRELACKHCDYLALDNTQLVLHERRSHTGERPFVCDACGAGYHSRRCLLQHVEGHRTNATVQCESCPLKFKSARHLARHRYNIHRKKKKKRSDH